MTPVNRVLSAVLVAICAAFAVAQDDSSSKVRVKRAVVDRGTVVIDLKVEAGWHIYAVNGEGGQGNETKIAVDKPFEIAGPIVEPKPIHHKHDFIDEDTKQVTYTEEYEKHEGDITLRIPVKGGSGAVKGSINVTSCDKDKCLPPGKLRFLAEPGSAPAAPESKSTTETKPAVPETKPTPGSRPVRKVVSAPKRLGKIPADDQFSVLEVSYPDPITSDRFDVHVVAVVGPGFHIYSFKESPTGILTTFAFSKPDGASPAVVLSQEGDIKSETKPRHHKGPQEDYDYFEGRVVLDVPVHAFRAASTTGAAGAEVAFTFGFTVGYQTCTMDYCLRPAEAVFELAANAVPGADWTTEPAPTATRPAEDSSRGGGDAVPAVALNVEFATEPASLEPNKSGNVVVRVKRADGKALARPDGRPFSAADVQLYMSEGENLFEEGEPTAEVGADGSLTLRQPVKVAAEAREGEIAVSGSISIGGIGGDFSGKAKIVAPLLGFILIAAISALLALLTPCVFPMIPVTISIFTKQAEAGQQSPAKLGLIYCIGIIASFTAIGAAFTAFLGGDAANVFAQHWITQLVIAALFVMFALSLLGMFDLAVPQPIMAMVERTTTRRMELASAGHGASMTMLLMGLLFAITTFTCTAPFIGGLLAGAASSGWTRPVVGMLVFSSVLAVPFFFLALFPAQLKKLPKSGGWLNETKVVMGFIELSAAVKFLNAADLSLEWEFFTRNTCLAAWIGIFGLTGLYLIGVFRMPKDMPRQKTGVLAAVFAILFVTTAIYLSTGLNGKVLGTFIEGWLPPMEERFQEHASGTKAGYANRFKEDYDAALAEARNLNVPLFVDFTGFT
jgi:cytochrome c biogenesis protein CcdA